VIQATTTLTRAGVHTMLAAPGAFARLVHRRRGDHSLKPGARRPGQPSGGPGLRILAPTLTPISRETTSSEALSGGSNLATALSLNACPYRATSVLHRRPRVLGSIEATSILTRGALPPVGPTIKPAEIQKIYGTPPLNEPQELKAWLGQVLDGFPADEAAKWAEDFVSTLPASQQQSMSDFITMSV